MFTYISLQSFIAANMNELIKKTAVIIHFIYSDIHDFKSDIHDFELVIKTAILFPPAKSDLYFKSNA